MTHDEVLAALAALPGVSVVTASAATGAPEVAWGDSFASYDPDGDLPPDRWLPFATVVTNDYPGFDTASQLSRPGVFRLNVAVGRRAFTDLLGYPPAALPEHRDAVDFAATDVLLPHPTYATQGWVSVVAPGPATDALVRSLIVAAHARAVERHRPPAEPAQRDEHDEHDEHG